MEPLDEPVTSLTDQPGPKSRATTRARREARMEIVAPASVPLVRPGDDLGDIVVEALGAAGCALRDGDVVVLAQKIVSKAEDRYVALETVTPSARALALAEEVDKDARLVELILRESTEVVRHRPGVLIVAHRLGTVMANAGIDQSNVEPLPPGPDGALRPRVLLLPKDPDASCARLRAALRHRTGADVAVIINDSVGRAWRNGTVGMALGAAGLSALDTLNGKPDLFDRPLQATEVGLADEIAAAASLAMGQADEGRPLVLLRGLPGGAGGGNATDLVRPRTRDLFR